MTVMPMTRPTLLHVVASLVDVLDIDDRDALASYLTSTPRHVQLTRSRESVVFAAAHDLDEIAADEAEHSHDAYSQGGAALTRTTARDGDLDESLTEAAAAIADAADALAVLGAISPDPFPFAVAQHQALTALALVGAAGAISTPMPAPLPHDFEDAHHALTRIRECLEAAYDALTTHRTFLEDRPAAAALREAALVLRELLVGLAQSR